MVRWRTVQFCCKFLAEMYIPKIFVYFLLVITMGLFLIEGSLARPLPDQTGERFKDDNLIWPRLSEFASMIPKGVPVPPSGPSPGIN